MAHWKPKHQKDIAILLNNNCCKAVFVGVGNNGTTTKDVFYYPEHPDIIIGFNLPHRWYYIWNAYLHSSLCRATISDKVHDDSPINAVYSPLQNGRGEYEKKLIVHEERIEYFCNHWLELLTPNSQDSFTDFSCVLWADRDHPNPKSWRTYVDESSENELMYRERIAAERYARDSSFPTRIKQAYGNQCAVCRCDIVEILEAAHIRAVQDFGNDSLSNGICLCRNHHKLYDSHLLELNGNFTFSALSESLAKDELYRFIVKKYKGNMIKPNYMGEYNEKNNS